MLKMKGQIIQRKIRQVRKTMGKSDKNLCKQAQLEGQHTCKGENLFTENSREIKEEMDKLSKLNDLKIPKT